MRAYERLMKYAAIDTQSDESGESRPSTAKQFDLARVLEQEMKDLGISDVFVSEYCVVYGCLPASPGYEDCDPIGFIAHLDTAPDFTGTGVKPVLHPDYDGGDLPLGESGRVLSPEMFPDLKDRIGQTLMTSDGTTLLGADDKAGIAEIMTAVEELIRSGRPHGKVCIAFTPDEEIGGGAQDLDLERFGAKYAYTVDGDKETQIVYENFNAAAARFEINGVSIHPGDSKDRMVNAGLVAAQICRMLPETETPRHTSGYEGFFHLTSIEGNVEKACASFIVRDHSASHFEARLEMLRHIEKSLNEEYGTGTAVLTIRQQYRNMAEEIEKCMHLVDNAKAVIRELGAEPDISPVRGGTDGAQLTFRGLPCPNLGTGGDAFHGPYEHISVEGMDFSTKVILGIIGKYAVRNALSQ